MEPHLVDSADSQISLGEGVKFVLILTVPINLCYWHNAIITQMM